MSGRNTRIFRMRPPRWRSATASEVGKGGAGHEKLLSERLERLDKKLSELEGTGMDGQMYSQRIAGDFYRLMNTALLYCSDLLSLHERQQEQARTFSDAAKTVMEYAANAEGGQAYLQLWLAGEHNAIRKRWPDAPAM